MPWLSSSVLSESSLSLTSPDKPCFSSKAYISSLAFPESLSSGYLNMLVAPLVYIFRSSALLIVSTIASNTSLTIPICSPAWLSILDISPRCISCNVRPVSVVLRRRLSFRRFSGEISSLIVITLFLIRLPSITITARSLFGSSCDS